MKTITLDGVRIDGICACVPAKAEDNLARCTELYGDAAKAQSIVNTTGIRYRRVLDDGVSALDLGVKAARQVLDRTHTQPDDIGALIYVTFTPERLMPCNACIAQTRLGLATNIIAFDLNLACSGWLYGVYVAGLLAKSTGKKVLLLDGDTQTPHLDAKDAATVPLLADAGTATLVAPSMDEAATPFEFAFMADGSRGDALQLPFGGTIAMDGFGVFKFVTTDVLKLIGEFLTALGVTAADFDAFVPHQANMFMIEQIAKKFGFDAARLKKSGDVFGNSSSASVPVTIAHTQARGTLLVSGFGGGLSAAVARLVIAPTSNLSIVEL